MKNALFILFLLGFCVNQLHIIEPIADYYHKHLTKTVTDTNKDASADEEDGAEKEELEKEIEYFIAINYAGHLSNILDVESNRTIRYLSLLYSDPSTKKDIKPPRFA